MVDEAGAPIGECIQILFGFLKPKFTQQHRMQENSLTSYHPDPEMDPFNESPAPELQYTEFSTKYLVTKTSNYKKTI